MVFRYFAYGSNMWMPRMVARCASARFVETTVLHGWRTTYDKPSLDGSAKVNIRPDPQGTVHGVVYAIDDQDRPSLDVAEPRYTPISTAVGLTYTFTGEPFTEPPYRWYVELVEAGARSHGLDPPMRPDALR